MDFIKELLLNPQTQVSVDESMAKHTGYGVGGKAKYFIIPYSLEGLKHVLSVCTRNNLPCKMLGNGTNILVSENGYKGAVICLKYLDKISIEKDVITAYSGVALCNLVKFARINKLYGGEGLSGIPATVGGAIVMNASAFGVSVGEFVNEVHTLHDNSVKIYTNEECRFSYRSSIFLNENNPIILAKFKFNKDIKSFNNVTIKDCQDMRKNLQPAGRTCGCVFKNPINDYAGRLIDLANLKGTSLGGARISEKHANFIIADKNATAFDIYNLVKLIKKTVYQNFNVILEEEIEFLGDF